ncbi:hypothetical protein METP1_01754 [Methanosarcinales archaeon]|nr:hypothetical protein METP1_01754 [Methanosarcinales archaeon]
MYYASKSGTKMSRDEFKGWLDALQAQTTEFIKRNKDAVYSGDNYANLINANINSLNYDQAALEIERVNQNKNIMANDIKITIDKFNQNVEVFNNWGK